MSFSEVLDSSKELFLLGQLFLELRSTYTKMS